MKTKLMLTIILALFIASMASMVYASEQHITFDLLTDEQVQAHVLLQTSTDYQLMELVGASKGRVQFHFSRDELNALSDQELMYLMSEYHNIIASMNSLFGTTLLIPEPGEEIWCREPIMLLLSGELSFDMWFGYVRMFAEMDLDRLMSNAIHTAVQTHDIDGDDWIRLLYAIENDYMSASFVAQSLRAGLYLQEIADVIPISIDVESVTLNSGVMVNGPWIATVQVSQLRP